MIKVITSVGERMLGVILPQREVMAQVAESCHEQRRCMACWSVLGTTWQKRWCCTSSRGTECTSWETYIKCLALTTC